jgi:phosphoglucomutase
VTTPDCGEGGVSGLTGGVPIFVAARAPLAGEPIEARLTRAPGNNEPIGGIKVVAKNGWFAARPSGTEAVYKIYAECFRSEDHLKQVQDDARTVVGSLFKKT